MERIAYLWDELDDLLWAARHVLRKSWQGLVDRAPRPARVEPEAIPADDAPPATPAAAL